MSPSKYAPNKFGKPWGQTRTGFPAVDIQRFYASNTLTPSKIESTSDEKNSVYVFEKNRRNI